MDKQKRPNLQTQANYQMVFELDVNLRMLTPVNLAKQGLQKWLLYPFYFNPFKQS